MQNLAASTNLQLFSKALQESAQKAEDGVADQQQHHHTRQHHESNNNSENSSNNNINNNINNNNNNPAISAADLQQFMISQLDQQLYLSQLAANNFAAVPETTTILNGGSSSGCSSSSSTSSTAPATIALHSAGPVANSATAMSCPSELDNISSPHTIGATKTTASGENGGGGGILQAVLTTVAASGAVDKQPKLEPVQQLWGSNAASPSPAASANNSTNADALSAVQGATAAAQLAQQKLVEQLFEAAVSGNVGANQLEGGAATRMNEELGQLMAQLIGGHNMLGDGSSDLQAAHLAQHLAAASQQQRVEMQSPTSQQQTQISLLDQLQLLQMLGMTGGGGATTGNAGSVTSNVAGLAEILAGAVSTAGTQFTPNSSFGELVGDHLGAGGQQQQKGGGGGSSGGSPNKGSSDTYCEICNKTVCNRYFLRHHMAKKHGIGVASPVKLGNGNFFGSPHSASQSDEQQQQPGRAQSANLYSQRRGSPSTLSSKTSSQKQQQQQHHQLLCSSTPSATTGLRPQTTTVSAANGSLTDAALLTDQQLVSQCLTQQLFAQLGVAPSTASSQTAVSNTASTIEQRPIAATALIEQLLGAGLPLADLLQTQQNLNAQAAHRSTPSPSDPTAALNASLNAAAQAHQHQSQMFNCSHCAREFPTQTALFQHQLTEHIGSASVVELQQLQQQHLSSQNDQHLSPLALRWALGGDLVGGGSAGTETVTTSAAQQQQILGQLLSSSPFQQANHLMLPGFCALNASGAELDSSAALLAKLNAEFTAVSQAHQGTASTAGAAAAASILQSPQSLLLQNGLSLGGGGGQTQIGANKPPTQKRQYSSTSKNFCDLCNKEVCNKYFLRTHMLKMHNIVIDENKVVIANIDTTEKEKRGEVEFRCEICHRSVANRDQLRAHKREVHGMQIPQLFGCTLSNSLRGEHDPLVGGIMQSVASVDGDQKEQQQHKLSSASSTEGPAYSSSSCTYFGTPKRRKVSNDELQKIEDTLDNALLKATPEKQHQMVGEEEQEEEEEGEGEEEEEGKEGEVVRFIEIVADFLRKFGKDKQIQLEFQQLMLKHLPDNQ